MAKKPAVKQEEKTIKEEEKSVEKTIPKIVERDIKILKSRIYKDIEEDEFLKTYWEKFEEKQKEYPMFGENVIHKKTVASLKNSKKLEKLGGSIDKYYGIVLGSSKPRDIYERKRFEILSKWKDDPESAIDEGLIMVKKEINPVTGEEERLPFLDQNGNIVPRDNREFFINNENKTKNSNFGKPLPISLRKTVIGFFADEKGNSGVFIEELRDEQTELTFETNKLLKFSARTINKEVEILENNQYLTKEAIKDMIEDMGIEAEADIISEGYLNMIKKEYKKVFEEKIETTIYMLRSVKSSYFEEPTRKEVEEFCKPLLSEYNGDVDIDYLYKKHMFPFTSDCSNLVKYHNDHKEKNGEINYNEFISIQDALVLQINTEANMAGNITMYIEDKSLFTKQVEHMNIEIESIPITIPSYIKIDFTQDSRVNIVGSIFQFAAKDEEGKELFEELYDKEGNILVDDKGEPIKTPILDYPRVMAFGIYAIPQYKVEVKTIDMTEEDDILEDIDGETDDISDEEMEEITEAIKENKNNVKITKEEDPW